ncbi:tRNA-dihydrouridine synthase [Treponema bryantii]|uniref:tRNA-dihydrouridine synthase n=1 Tax=Treponema bryantii TaxID=163 RepID=A0A1H9I2Y7_9SPIR|nr:tRNA-dihydrouridine synthase family protein [Treponema bryantii]SEQ68898.1 tRNA-dihydrouridine synthase [Treponema bryantii]
MSIKLICGPMATISHPAFRILVEQFGGCDEYYNEMINAGSLLNAGPFERYYIDPTPVPEKIVWQLTGHDIEKMVPAARQLLELPGIGLDINMGCSAPDVYKTGAGIGWMTRPIEETRQMMSEVGNEVSFYNNEHPESQKRFSVKLRLGDEDFTDEGFYSFCDMLVENGAKLLTLHPRTKKEKLSRPPRYSYCQTLCERYKGTDVKIYLNGNVKDVSSAEYALKCCPDISGIMISRASVQKPWIFREISSEKNKEIKVDMEKVCYDYIKDIEQYQPKEFYKTRLQRFFTYFCMNFQFAHYAQTQFVNAAEKGIDELKGAIREYFEKCPDDKTKVIRT